MATTTKRTKYYTGKPTKHGMTNTIFYTKWRAMVQRCFNPKDPRYKDYGARGIKVCDRWLQFINFYDDMKDGFSDKLTIERIDVAGNYEKDNCKWATNLEQQQNKTNTVRLTINGVTAHASRWSKISGTNVSVITFRFHNGWPHIECVYGRDIEKSN